MACSDVLAVSNQSLTAFCSSLLVCKHWYVVGDADGRNEGGIVGGGEGAGLGDFDGALLGCPDGLLLEGLAEGLFVGKSVVRIEGDVVGVPDGLLEGLLNDGAFEGKSAMLDDGDVVGMRVGFFVGDLDGDKVSSSRVCSQLKTTDPSIA